MIRQKIQQWRQRIRSFWQQAKKEWRRMARPLRHWLILLAVWFVLTVALSWHAVSFVQQTFATQEEKTVPTNFTVTIPKAKITHFLEVYTERANRETRKDAWYHSLIDEQNRTR